MSNDNNVIDLFPDGQSNNSQLVANTTPIADDKSIEFINQIIDSENNGKIHVMSTQIGNMIAQIIQSAGYQHPMESEVTEADFYLVVESVKSLLCQMHYLTHPLQDVADKYIHIDPDLEQNFYFGESNDLRIEPED